MKVTVLMQALREAYDAGWHARNDPKDELNLVNGKVCTRPFVDADGIREERELGIIVTKLIEHTDV